MEEKPTTEKLSTTSSESIPTPQDTVAKPPRPPRTGTLRSKDESVSEIAPVRKNTITEVVCIE